MTITTGGHHGHPAAWIGDDRRRLVRRLVDRLAVGVGQENKKGEPDATTGFRYLGCGAGVAPGKRMAKKRRDPRSDPGAGLEDFVRRINRIGFPQFHTVKYPLWTVEDVKWAATLTERLYKDLSEFAYHRHDLDPLERVLRARMAVWSMAHTMSHRSSKRQADPIVRSLSRDND